MSDHFEEKPTSPCSACGTATLPEDLVQVDGDYFCNDCICEACGEGVKAKPATYCAACLIDLRAVHAEYEKRFAADNAIEKPDPTRCENHPDRLHATGSPWCEECIRARRFAQDAGPEDPRDGSIPHPLEGMDRSRPLDARDDLLSEVDHGE